MKLYFYVFENNEIRFSECEAEEKPKSYLLKEDVPGFYGIRVLKTEIGLKAEYPRKQIVVLDKRDDKLVKKYLLGYLCGEIEKKQKEIEDLREKVKSVNDWNGD